MDLGGNEGELGQNLEVLFSERGVAHVVSLPQHPGKQPNEVLCSHHLLLDLLGRLADDDYANGPIREILEGLFGLRGRKGVSANKRGRGREGRGGTHLLPHHGDEIWDPIRGLEPILVIDLLVLKHLSQGYFGPGVGIVLHRFPVELILNHLAHCQAGLLGLCTENE